MNKHLFKFFALFSFIVASVYSINIYSMNEETLAKICIGLEELAIAATKEEPASMSYSRDLEEEEEPDLFNPKNDNEEIPKFQQRSIKVQSIGFHLEEEENDGSIQPIDIKTNRNNRRRQRKNPTESNPKNRVIVRAKKRQSKTTNMNLG